MKVVESNSVMDYHDQQHCVLASNLIRFWAVVLDMF